MKNIRMVGIGMMGHGIASNIVKRGYGLGLFEHAGNQPLDTLRAAGATGFASLEQLAAYVDVVILVLTGSGQVEAVLRRTDGLVQSLCPDAIVIDCSTSMPASTVPMAQAVQAAGGRFLDVPMTRTPKEAAEGRLNLLVGGDAALLEECRPLLRCFSENITLVGPVESGHSMKLLHNHVLLGMVTLLSEAAACGRRSGVSPDAFVDVLAKGCGGGVALERLKPFLLARDTSGLRFSIANAREDLAHYNNMADDAGAYKTVAAAVLSTLDAGGAGSRAAGDPRKLSGGKRTPLPCLSGATNRYILNSRKRLSGRFGPSADVCE